MKHFARYVVSVVLALGLIYGGIAGRSSLRSGECLAEARETLKVEELTGLRFEVTYLSCNTIAKDEAIRVYAEAVAPDESWFFLDNGEITRHSCSVYDPTTT